MSDGPEPIELDAAFVGAEELPVQFANAFTGVVGPNAIFLDIGSMVPPLIETEDDLAQAGFVPIKPIARIALAPKGLDDLIEILENTRQHHLDLTRELDEGSQ